jgi:AraC-like DNA-binding protein
MTRRWITPYQLEILIHLLFWGAILSMINIQWRSNWFDPSLRPGTPAPMSLIIFAIYFYIHTYLLIPRYFSLQTLKWYLPAALALFVVPELIRIAAYQQFVQSQDFSQALFSRDSFLFGSPSPFFLALNASLIYRFIRNKLLQRPSPHMEKAPAAVDKPAAHPYEHASPLTEAEARQLTGLLQDLMANKELYLDPGLSLRSLAEEMDSTEKKVSYLINQHLHTNFYELVNQYRVEKFKAEVQNADSSKLSIVGLALNCGFRSKSSFYRAFKSQVAMSPSEYIKKVSSRQ